MTRIPADSGSCDDLILKENLFKCDPCQLLQCEILPIAGCSQRAVAIDGSGRYFQDQVSALALHVETGGGAPGETEEYGIFRLHESLEQRLCIVPDPVWPPIASCTMKALSAAHVFSRIPAEAEAGCVGPEAPTLRPPVALCADPACGFPEGLRRRGTEKASVVTVARSCFTGESLTCGLRQP